MDLSGVVKAYDVRGIVPEQLNEDVARALGAAFADLVAGTRHATIVTAHDMRESGPGLARAFAEGALRRGASVVEIGLASTDMLYFASGHLGCPARCSPPATTRRSTTASSSAGPAPPPIGADTGLAEIRDRAER